MQLTRKQAENRSKILDLLYAKRPLSRIDIANETKITPAKTGSIINSLIQANIVQELGELNDESVGRKKTLLDIKPLQRYYLGVEISEKFLAFVIADNTGQELASQLLPYRSEQENELLNSSLIQPIQAFLAENTHYPISGMAVGLPGHINLEESPSIISHNPLWKHIDLEKLQHAFSFPVYFGNKVHCLTLAERLFAYHQKDQNFIIFHVARGMNCSYMYNGSLYSQDNVLIGEVGHTVINPEGEQCPCGKNGCLQVYASEAALVQKAQILYQSSRVSLLKTLVEQAEDIDIQVILTAYKLGDVGCIELLHTACKYLGIAISNLCQLIDMEKIYLDGELFSYPLVSEKVLAHVQQAVQLFPKQKRPELRIIPYSALNIARASVSLCVYHEFLDKQNLTSLEDTMKH